MSVQQAVGIVIKNRKAVLHRIAYNVQKFENSAVSFVRKNAVMCIAFVAALVTSVIVPVDAQYAGYFDFKTLTCLFCVLAVVCALKNINFFYMRTRSCLHNLYRLNAYCKRYGAADVSAAGILRA